MSSSVFSDLSYGLYIIGSKKGDKINAQVANTAMQVCADPAKISICLNKLNLTHEFIMESRVFSICVISTDWTLEEIGKFGFRSGRDIDKFENTQFISGKTGSPILKNNIISALECEVEQYSNVGTHTLFIGKVVNTYKLTDDFPMTYKYYHEVVKGFTPQSAPVSE